MTVLKLLLISAIIGVGLWLAFPETFHQLQISVSSFFGSSDPLISKCLGDFKNLQRISQQKYGISISIITYEKFENVVEAETFFDTWKTFLQVPVDISAQKFPLVLFAIKLKGPQGQLSTVLVCDNSGTLIEASRKELL